VAIFRHISLSYRRAVAGGGGLRDHIKLGDPAVPDLEGEHNRQMTPGCNDDSNHAVDQRRLRKPLVAGKGERLLGNRRGAVELYWSAGRRRRAIGTQHDVRIEQRYQRIEVAAARRGKERCDDLALADEIGIGDSGGSCA